MIQYSNLVEAVKNNVISINIWGGATGTTRMFSTDGTTFDGEQKSYFPSFNLKWDKFSLSLSMPITGILKTKGIEVNTTMFKSKYLIKDGLPVADYLYLDGDINSIGLSSNRLPLSEIDFEPLYTNISFDDYMAATIRALEYGVENKVIDYFNKNVVLDKFTIPGISDSDMSHLRSIGLTAGGFNPKIEYANKDQQKSPIKVNIKSFSSIPMVAKVLHKVESNETLTPSESLINTYINKYNTATSESLSASSEIVKSELEKAKDITRATNYSVIYRGYYFGREVDEVIEGNSNNYQISFSINKG